MINNYGSGLLCNLKDERCWVTCYIHLSYGGSRQIMIHVSNLKQKQYKIIRALLKQSPECEVFNFDLFYAFDKTRFEKAFCTWLAAFFLDFPHLPQNELKYNAFTMFAQASTCPISIPLPHPPTPPPPKKEKKNKKWFLWFLLLYFFCFFYLLT